MSNVDAPRAMHIIGAGMAGMVAAHALRSFRPVILEAQPTLPHNHEALLRFRNADVSGVTGIPFQECMVRKAIFLRDVFFDRTNVFLANLYSRKVLKQVAERSIWNLDPATRYIAPPNFLELLAAPLQIKYNFPVHSLPMLQELVKAGPVVSTIPMPIMMKLIGWKDIPDFKAHPIYSVQVDINVPRLDVYQTIYFPDPRLSYYRASITGSRLIVEFTAAVSDAQIQSDIKAVIQTFGLDPAHYSVGRIKMHPYGKIAPIDADLRREFIYTLTREFGVYSLGRFATWRNILLDDVVGDCGIIERLIGGEVRRNRYQQSLATVRSI